MNGMMLRTKLTPINGSFIFKLHQPRTINVEIRTHTVYCASGALRSKKIEKQNVMIKRTGFST
tara:strand:+ start:1678 stop:1866 length:189 start_codon:yes stop_codon:yes gene_type:complete